MFMVAGNSLLFTCRDPGETVVVCFEIYMQIILSDKWYRNS